MGVRDRPAWSPHKPICGSSLRRREGGFGGLGDQSFTSWSSVDGWHSAILTHTRVALLFVCWPGIDMALA